MIENDKNALRREVRKKILLSSWLRRLLPPSPSRIPSRRDPRAWREHFHSPKERIFTSTNGQIKKPFANGAFNCIFWFSGLQKIQLERFKATNSTNNNYLNYSSHQKNLISLLLKAFHHFYIIFFNSPKNPRA